MAHHRLLLSEVQWVRFNRPLRNLVHRHTFFESCLVVSGRGEFDHGEDHFALGPGDLFVADVGVFHEIKSLRTRNLTLLFISFAVAEATGSDEGNTEKDLIIRSFLKKHAVWCKDQQHLTGDFRRLLDHEEVNRLPHSDFFLREAKQLLVLKIMTALIAKTFTESAGDTVPHTALNRALQAIDMHLHEPIWVKTIAKSSGMSERNLRRLFRRQVGRTVSGEIQEHKAQRAVLLLGRPEFNIAEVDREVGIEDPAQFSRLFKKVMGVSPHQFRTSKIPIVSRQTIFVKIGSVTMKTEFRD